MFVYFFPFYLLHLSSIFFDSSPLFFKSQSLEMKKYPADPQEALAPELFTLLLSCLDPQSIGQSSAVSSNWRKTINSTPTLHQEIDLSHIVPPIDEDEDRGPTASELTHYLLHLSSLSNHRVKKATFHMDPFCQDYTNTRNWKANTLSIPFGILELSKHTLKEINVHMEEHHYLHVQLLDQLAVFPNLRKVLIETPCSIDLEAGEEFSNGKWVCLRSSNNGLDFTFNAAQIMKKVRDFVGSGLTEFRSYRLGPDDEMEIILDELMHSKRTLQRWETTNLWWESLFDCPNTTSISINFKRDGLEGIGEIPVPARPSSSTSSLKLLYLSLYASRSYDLDWESLASRIGNVLETFRLREYFTPQRFFPAIPLLSFIRCYSQSLKHFELQSYGQDGDHDLVGSSLCGVSFPNLESLAIGNAPSSVYRFFSKVRLSKLQICTFNPNADWLSPVWDQDQMACLHHLLKSSQSTLSTFETNAYAEKPELEYWEENLRFQKLTKLVLKGYLGIFAQVFSKFQYPNLLFLDVIEDYRSLFNVPAGVEFLEESD